MNVKVINNGVVFYQTSADDGLPEMAILVHRNASNTLVLSQENQSIVLNLHRFNLKEFKAAMDSVLFAYEEMNRKKK